MPNPLKHWKTTVLGLCFLAIALKGSIHFNAAGHLAMTQQDWFIAAIGLAGAATGAASKDAQ